MRRSFDPDRGFVRENDEGDVLLPRLESYEQDDEEPPFDPRRPSPPVRSYARLPPRATSRADSGSADR